MLVAQSCLTLSNHMDYSLQDPLFMEFSSKNTGVGSHSLLQRIFLTQGLNLGLLHCRQILCQLSYQGILADHQRIDAFSLWCWKRFLTVPWPARSSQSILKEINLEYSLEGLMLKLKLPYFGHLMGRTDSLEKTLMERLKADRKSVV